MIAAYFLLPIDRLGPRHPLLSWIVFAVALGLVAVLLLRQIRDVLLDRPGTRPGLVIPLLICLSVLVFATTYLALAKSPGEFSGLTTRVDSLYFTVVTLATVGYGDIFPRGQLARLVTIVQLLYGGVFLTAAATALSRRVHNLLAQRIGRGSDG
ncbi:MULTISPECIES: potassium channel family protein [unclassified Streptomyces]|uniref:potassium channel family protein n=1 Tax=unclassified Streptomyces TaxID=2593676 RepID=UPI001F03AD94|nr:MULTISPECIES: potassium channel family protein [unclassified Streptomyces]MCH0562864.1 two pore domain potassium channel family protein [Streptomyces sp. MUM 2J]MCH0572785.1 two pore domain potassium channel family protein [Streptomyces sp. MUM 136J]